jgi:hypothetical protein
MKKKILELELKNRSNKILGVGLPKTGTTSLNRALGILGYRSQHSPFQYTFPQSLGIPMYRWENVVENDFKNERLLECVPEAGSIKKDLKFSDWDALTNFGEHTYPILDKKFPNSKFILTVRDRKAWLKSIYFLLKGWGTCFTEEGKIDGFVYWARKMHIFHCVNYDEDYLNVLYDNHLRNVEYYFKDRRQDLLTIDICGGEGWEKLCPFLDKDVPYVSFPHKNKTVDKKNQG